MFIHESERKRRNDHEIRDDDARTRFDYRSIELKKSKIARARNSKLAIVRQFYKISLYDYHVIRRFS